MEEIYSPSQLRRRRCRNPEWPWFPIVHITPMVLGLLQFLSLRSGSPGWIGWRSRNIDRGGHPLESWLPQHNVIQVSEISVHAKI